MNGDKRNENALDGAALVERVETYFRRVDSKDMEGALALLTPDCTVTVESAGIVHEGRDTGIRSMFQRLFDKYPGVWHGDFRHVPDPDGSAIACQFSVINTDSNGTEHHLNNCNFFRLKGALFHRISIYMSGGENTLT